MNTTGTALTVTAARANLYKLIDEANEFHRPVHIHGKRESAVLIAEEDWRSIQETLYLLSIPGMRQSIRKGMNTPIDKCVEDLAW